MGRRRAQSASPDTGPLNGTEIPRGAGIRCGHMPHQLFPRELPFPDSRMRRACALGEVTMKIRVLAVLVGALLADQCRAEEVSQLVVPEIVVTGTRLPESQSQSVRPTTVITAEQIA